MERIILLTSLRGELRLGNFKRSNFQIILWQMNLEKQRPFYSIILKLSHDIHLYFRMLILKI